MTLAILFGGALDPISALMGVQSSLRDVANRQREGEIRFGELRSETEHDQRMEQLEKAAAAIKKMTKRRPWLRKMIGAIITAVGAVASIFGGAGAGLVAVGVVLIATADILNTLVEKGVIHGERAQKIVSITAAALKIVGALVMTAASGGSGAAEIGEAAATIACAASNLASDIQTTVALVEATLDTRNAVFEFKADLFRLRADTHEVAADEADDDAERALNEMTVMHRRFERVVRNLRAMAEIREEASRAVVCALA